MTTTTIRPVPVQPIAPAALPVVEVVDCGRCGHPVVADDHTETWTDCQGGWWMHEACHEDHNLACDHPGCRGD